MLGGLSEVAPGYPYAYLPIFAQLGKSAERVGDIQGVMKVRHHDRGAEADRYL